MTTKELEDLVVELARRVDRLEELVEAKTVPELEEQHRSFVARLRERQEG